MCIYIFRMGALSELRAILPAGQIQIYTRAFTAHTRTHVTTPSHTQTHKHTNTYTHAGGPGSIINSFIFVNHQGARTFQRAFRCLLAKQTRSEALQEIGESHKEGYLINSRHAGCHQYSTYIPRACDLCNDVLGFSLLDLDKIGPRMNLQITPERAAQWSALSDPIGFTFYVQTPALCNGYLQNNICQCGDFHDMCLECEQLHDVLQTGGFVCPFEDGRGHFFHIHV